MPYYPTNGQFGGGWSNPQYGGTPWQSDWWQAPDPSAAIAGQQRDIRRQAASNYNSMANRLGAMGMGSGGGTPAQTKFGNIAADASVQMADVANRYAYDAQQQEANRRLQAQTNAGNLWNQQQERNLAWDTTQGGWNQQNQQDYWSRMYDSMLRGGSTNYMNQWQAQQTPWAQRYAQSINNPWMR